MASIRAHVATEPARWVWFFDLDNTLHNASDQIFTQINARMTDYVAHHLQIDHAQADVLRHDYWTRYGATLLGLVRHHAIDPHHFLRETHDFDVAALVRAERGLAHLFARLPGRKVLLTNAPDRYAGTVIRKLGLNPYIARRYGIEAMCLHGVFRPKPSRRMLAYLLARERVLPHNAILVEDTLDNLKAARALGLRTVLLQKHRRGVFERAHWRPAYIDLRIESLQELPRTLAFLRK